MKRVFYVHSHITFAMAMLYQSNQEKSLDEVFFIVSRKYSLPGSLKALDVSGLYDYLEEKEPYQKIFYLKHKIRDLDKKLTDFLGDVEFELFVPQFNHSIFQILCTHSRCRYVSLMEEGITSYKSDLELYHGKTPSVKQIMSSFFSDRFIVKNPHYVPFPSEKFCEAICLDDSCFPYMKKSEKTILPLKLAGNLPYTPSLQDGSHVLVLDSFRERTRLAVEIYLDILGRTFSKDTDLEKKIWIKFHPEQKEEIRIKTLQYVKDELKFSQAEVLDDTVILEFEFLLSKNFVVYGMHSSLLFYADTFGHKAISSIEYSSSFEEVDTYINHIMDSFQKKRYMSYV